MRFLIYFISYYHVKKFVFVNSFNVNIIFRYLYLYINTLMGISNLSSIFVWKWAEVILI